MKHQPRFTPGRALWIALLAILPGFAGELSLRTLALDKGGMPEWHVQVADGKFEKLDWPASQPSAPIRVQADRELQLFSPGTDGEGSPEFKPVQKVAVPEGARELLLLGSPAPGEGQPELVAVTDNYLTAGFRDWLVINRSEQQVTLRFGKGHDPIELEAGESGIYRIEGEPDKGGEAVAQAMTRGEVRKIYSTFWSASDKQRSLVLFTNHDGRVKLRRIIDHLPAAGP